jgi:hypothetical protein
MNVSSKNANLNAIDYHIGLKVKRLRNFFTVVHEPIMQDVLVDTTDDIAQYAVVSRSGSKRYQVR